MALLRSGADDDELRDVLSRVWQKRSDRYSERREPTEQPLVSKVEMYRVGG